MERITFPPPHTHTPGPEKDVRWQGPSATAGGTQNWYNQTERQLGGFLHMSRTQATGSGHCTPRSRKMNIGIQTKPILCVLA